MKGDYEEFHAFGRRKNKPNSNPIAGVWLEILNKAGGEKFLSLAFFLRVKVTLILIRYGPY
jgi:hypothetical protein